MTSRRVSNGNIIRAIGLCENEESFLQNLVRFKSLMRFAWKRDIISIIGMVRGDCRYRKGSSKKLYLIFVDGFFGKTLCFHSIS